MGILKKWSVTSLEFGGGLDLSYTFKKKKTFASKARRRDEATLKKREELMTKKRGHGN